MTRAEIIEGIIEQMETCNSCCECGICPIQYYCDEWAKLEEEK